MGGDLVTLLHADRFEAALGVIARGRSRAGANLVFDANEAVCVAELGRTEEGIGYYLQSVALDPNYAQVREYLGEAYVTQGKIDLAKEQLQVIETLCGTGCEEYEDLAEAIETALP